MNLDILRRFVHIARVGSFTQAAQDLYVAQPALSKQMRRLEEEMGSTLFDRSGRRIKLTMEGRILLRHCHQILSEWGQAQKSLHEIVKMERGQVRLITFVTFAFYLLPMFLVDFIRNYPALDLEIEQAINEPIVQAVLQHKFEAGITTLPVGHPRLEEIPLYIEESMIIVNHKHPLYGRTEIPASEVGEHLLITSSLNENYRTFLWTVFKNLEVQLKVRYVVHYYPVVIQMVKEGLGAGLAPMVALKSVPLDKERLGVIRIDPPLQRTLGWIEPRGLIRSPPVLAFYSFLVNWLRNQNIVPNLVENYKQQPNKRAVDAPIRTSKV